MTGTDLTKLAIDLSAGTVTAALIKERYGAGVLSSVAALAAGGLVGIATNAAVDILDEHTGIVSGIGGLVDDVFDLF